MSLQDFERIILDVVEEDVNELFELRWSIQSAEPELTSSEVLYEARRATISLLLKNYVYLLRFTGVGKNELEAIDQEHALALLKDDEYWRDPDPGGSWDEPMVGVFITDIGRAFYENQPLADPT
jgi:hypothetical protein